MFYYTILQSFVGLIKIVNVITLCKCFLALAKYNQESQSKNFHPSLTFVDKSSSHHLKLLRSTGANPIKLYLSISTHSFWNLNCFIIVHDFPGAFKMAKLTKIVQNALAYLFAVGNIHIIKLFNFENIF
jgi:hypothetical protein